jgi:hypothetical protein
MIIAMQRLDEHPAIRASNATTNVYNSLLGNRAAKIPSQQYNRRGVFYVVRAEPLWEAVNCSR